MLSDRAIVALVCVALSLSLVVHVPPVIPYFEHSFHVLIFFFFMIYFVLFGGALNSYSLLSSLKVHRNVRNDHKSNERANQ